MIFRLAVKIGLTYQELIDKCSLEEMIEWYKVLQEEDLERFQVLATIIGNGVGYGFGSIKADDFKKFVDSLLPTKKKKVTHKVLDKMKRDFPIEDAV